MLECEQKQTSRLANSLLYLQPSVKTGNMKVDLSVVTCGQGSAMVKHLMYALPQHDMIGDKGISLKQIQQCQMDHQSGRRYQLGCLLWCRMECSSN